MTTKPRDMWDREDRLDFLDGWHEASEIGFHIQRDPNREVRFCDVRGQEVAHPADALICAGRNARLAYRESTGI